MPTPPTVSPPTLLTTSELRSNQDLTAQVSTFVNETFRRSHARFPERWDYQFTRFSARGSGLLDMLGEEGVLCVIFDDSSEIETVLNTNGEIGDEKENVNGTQNGHRRSRRVVACAAAVPWDGGSYEKAIRAPEGGPKEGGWEIKIVCVHGGEQYAKTGLAVRVVEFLGNWVCHRELGGKNLKNGTNGVVANGGEEAKWDLWIVTAEELQGPYWRRRGFTEVRRAIAEKGTWNSKADFEQVVLKREVCLRN